MIKFSDLNIKPKVKGLEGEKKLIDDVLNTEITIHSFRIEPSKYQDTGNGKCIWMQISIGDKKHPLFSGSEVLQELILRVPPEKFPFTTIIKKENRRFEFA